MKNEVRLLIESLETTDVYVNSYDVERVYGGPEEGGWYFDQGLLNESKKFSFHGNKERGLAHYDKAVEYAHQKAEELRNDNPAYRNRYKVEVSFNEGANYPKVAPQYC